MTRIKSHKFSLFRFQFLFLRKFKIFEKNIFENLERIISADRRMIRPFIFLDPTALVRSWDMANFFYRPFVCLKAEITFNVGQEPWSDPILILLTVRPLQFFPHVIYMARQHNTIDHSLLFVELFRTALSILISLAF